jgi:hypothetical protein
LNFLADDYSTLKKSMRKFGMKLMQGLIILGAVFLITGMAFFQMFMLFASLIFAKKVYLQHNPRQCGLTPT